MKKCIFIFLLIPISVSAGICSVDKNVKDYFLSIPYSQLMIADDIRGPLIDVSDREKAIELLDISNGFIELQNESILSLTQVVLFRTENKKPVIIVTQDGVSIQNITAFYCFENEWKDVTADLIPGFTDREISKLYQEFEIKVLGNYKTAEELSIVAHSLIRYRLPRYGREIEVYASHPDLSMNDQKTVFKFIPSLQVLPSN